MLIQKLTRRASTDFLARVRVGRLACAQGAQPYVLGESNAHAMIVNAPNADSSAKSAINNLASFGKAFDVRVLDAVTGAGETMAARGEIEPRGTFFSRASVKPWPPDFPKLFAHTTVSNITGHPDFKAAKAGDSAAAKRLVDALVKPERLKALAERYPNAIVVPVAELEPTGKNQIPWALGSALAKAGLPMSDKIVSRSTVSRRLMSAVDRLLGRKVFDGEVVRGKDYILVDDVVTQGGTLDELRTHIVNNGGNVVAVTSLGFSAGSNIIAVKPER